VIFALSQPAALLGLLAGFIVGIAARAAVQRAVTRTGSRGSSIGGAGLRSSMRRGFRRRLRPVGGSVRRPRTGIQLDPYGTVAAVISGVGWGPPAPLRPGRRPGPLPLIAAVAVHAALAAAALAVYVSAGGIRDLLHVVNLSALLHGDDVSLLSVGQRIALGFAATNLACGLLALVPIPPLEAGVWLWSRLPRSPGARRMAYHLLEEAWGVAALLVLVLLPLGGGRPVLLAVLDAVGDPLLKLV
jgi:hypothetical protein